ncbi:hypothetical protein O3P69_004490 [Scylla paramamosain]|uniref:Ionotropic glutamate receptor C-terminal domain-containing protein n=1 Tax=Scylla paramamosain TaxID=85552 RepID=A0AAW0UC94_SCYPA
MADEMEAWKGVTTELLKAIAQQPDCGVIFLSDKYPPDILVQELDMKWTQRRGAAFFRVIAMKKPSDVMLRFSQLVPLARRNQLPSTKLLTIRPNGISAGAGGLMDPNTCFHGARVNVTALPFPPFWDELEGPDNTHQYRGTDYNLFVDYSCCSQLHFPRGAHLLLGRERVAFLCSNIHMVLPQRREHYDFSFVYEYVSMDFCMAPPGLQPHWKAFYYPLSGLVWVATLLALLITPCFLFVAIRSVNQRTPSSVESGMSYGSVFQGMTGMLVGQSLPRRLPRTFSTRVLVATWLVFVIIFISAYCGNLTASLTLPKYPPRPETIPQLVDSVKKITMQRFGEDYKIFFSKSESPLFQKLALLMDFVPSLMAGQQQATEKSQAHIDNRRYQHHNIAKWFTRPDGSEMLYIGRDPIMPGQSALPLPHDAPYAANIDRLLMAVVEGGLYEKWASDLLFKVRQEKRIQLRKQQEDAEQEPTRSREMTLSLSMDHMQGAFMLLLLGLILAALVFGGELICQNFV